MRALLEDTWSRVRDELRSRVGVAVFDAWLADVRPLALERGVIHLEARNRMACDKIERLYRDVVADLLSAAIGTAVTVAVQPAPDAQALDELEVGPTMPVIDDSNRTAFLMLRALVSGRSLPSSLFYFHGPPGSGKTFLLDWWTAAVRRRGIWFRGRDLVDVVQTAIRERRTTALRAELTAHDTLVVDELHRMAGYIRVQQELARALEVRSRMPQPTLLVSRWHPHEIRDLDPGLRTWLCAGIVTRLSLPGPTARLAYLRALEGSPSRNGRAEAIVQLARKVQGSYPDLRRAWAFDRRAGPAERDRYFRLIEPRSTFDRCRDRVAARFRISCDELVGKSQSRRSSRARKVLSWLCLQGGLSRAEIGRYLGRTRAAISYAIKSIEREMAEDNELRLLAEALL